MARWVKLNVDAYSHPSVGVASDAAFHLYIASVCYCARFQCLEVHERFVQMALGRMSRKTIRELVELELWRESSQPGKYSVCGVGELWTRDRVPISDAIRQAIYDRDQRQCVACSATDNLTLDHRIPHSMGGSDKPENLQTLCSSCNSRKGRTDGAEADAIPGLLLLPTSEQPVG